MARKHRQEMTFGSGSFLDVLCNMVGILIILIAVVGMRVADKDDPVIDMTAPEPQVQEADPAIAARKLEIAARLAAHRQAQLDHEQESRSRQAEWERLLAEMQARNQQLARQTEQMRQQLAASSAAAEQEDDKRQKLAAMVAAAASQNADLHQNEKSLQQQALELMQRRKEVQEEIAARKVAQAIRKPVFEIVAHDGNSGTNRRPILIECRSDGLEFAAEKVAISARTLNDFSPDQNPLLAGAEALTTYWTLADAQQGNTQLKPYVLLIVRPGGTIGFYVARKYLEAMNQDYGYELVPDGAEIKWPTADPQAVDVCGSAVERAMQEPRSVAKRFSNGMGGRGGLGTQPGGAGNTGSRTGQSRDSLGDKQIVGANGDFQLSEVEELRNSSPQDSIGMLGPEWSPQRRKLASGRPGFAGEEVQQEQNQFTGSAADPQRNGTMPAGSDSDNIDPRDFTERESIDNNNTSGSSGAETNRRGFNLKPYVSQNGVQGVPSVVPPAPESTDRAGTPRSPASAGSGAPGPRPDMPASPLEEKQTSMPSDGGRDRKWGRGRSGAIGIERELILHLYVDRMSIVDGPVVALPPGISREEFHEMVAAMIQTESNTWGDPPKNFIWRPRLKIEVHPGGNLHYARLKELLQHWGLSSKVEQVLD